MKAMFVLLVEFMASLWNGFWSIPWLAQSLEDEFMDNGIVGKEYDEGGQVGDQRGDCLPLSF
jgi:hypothetical protein